MNIVVPFWMLVVATAFLAGVIILLLLMNSSLKAFIDVTYGPRHRDADRWDALFRLGAFLTINEDGELVIGAVLGDLDEFKVRLPRSAHYLERHGVISQRSDVELAVDVARGAEPWDDIVRSELEKVEWPRG